MKKVVAQKAQELTSHFDPINEEAAELLKPEFDPDEYLKLLLDHELYEDSIIFLAHGLPKREAIWWACVCVRSMTGDETKADDLASLQVAEKWVYDPDEKNRRLCGTLAEKGEYKSAHSWTAAAVFWSGGSITAEKDPAVEPAPYLYAHAVSGAILTAVGMGDADNIEDHFKSFIEKGMNIADGGNG
jgi:hypothetical protein